MIDRHLWEIEHPYYCSEGNYFQAGCNTRHESWADFLSDMGDADLDLNLLFRWDWAPPREEDDDERPITWLGDENYRDGTLSLFFMGQRKAFCFSHEVEVCRADEPAVREYLKVRYLKLVELWLPFGFPLTTPNQ